MSNPPHQIDSILLITVILSGAGFRRIKNPQKKSARRSLRGETGQHASAIRGERGGLHRQALHKPAPAGGDAAAKRADVGTACRSQHEQFLARQHRPKRQYRCSRLARRTRRRLGGRSGRGAGRRRCGTPVHGGDGLLTSGRDFRFVLFQALQCGGATGRHAGANLGIVASARASDRGNVRTARLAACRGGWLRGWRSRTLGGRPGGRRGSFFLGCSGRLGLCLCRGCCRLGLRFRRSSDGAHGALTAR